ncbi:MULTISPECIES: hypothetical protein [Comamonas]|uniref:hypothetical protein n=1 Tax=Comamonas TaxID=283 RepID=UPI00257DBA45|nr:MULTISPECIES: hypothetical protein [Comamonas]
MANYIEKSDQENKYDLLCEAYSHLDIEFIKGSSSELEIKEKIRLFVEPRAKFLFGEDIKIDIELDEGSFISKISILGFIGGIIMGYPQFKEGIRELQNDAVLITQAANMETIFITETKSCDRLRLEKEKVFQVERKR